jgi:hypothetical protein
VRKAIEITEEEMTMLIEASAGRALDVSFGPSGSWIYPERCPWAVEMVERQRAKAMTTMEILMRCAESPI